MTVHPPEAFNIADHFLDRQIRDGHGDRIALITEHRTWTYAQVHQLANRFGNMLLEAGIQPEQRVIIALPDSANYVGALFGILKIGAVVVMVNPHLKTDAVRHFFNYTRATAALVHRSSAEAFKEAAKDAPHLRTLLTLDTPDTDAKLAAASDTLETATTHRDDPAIWLFSGGTTGWPKGVVQSHTSFANTTECYAHNLLNYSADDRTLSVPKLFFGYATGSNLLFPFSVGASVVLFPERCTTEVLFENIKRWKPTILINVPTMIGKMLSHPDAAHQDFSSLRLATSAGEALPAELHTRWKNTFGTELLDGLGTAEMWHIFISNRPGDVRPGTLGQVVPGFEVRACDDDGNTVPAGEVGWLWVKGNSRAIGYWQHADKTRHAFRGEWYISGDMIQIDADGYVTYCGRGDDMLKVSGKWLSPREVENCLMQHTVVREVAVVGVASHEGLTKPRAYVCTHLPPTDTLADELKAFVRERLEPYKYPRDIVFMDDMPRTHLGKIDRGKLRKED